MADGDAALAIAAQGLIDRGEARAALALLAKAADSPHPDVFAARSTAHLALEEGERALDAARAALRLDPSHAAGAFNEARALMLLGEPEAAAAAFTAAQRAFPNVAEIAARLGEAAYLAGDDGAAEAALRRALALAPGHASAFHLLAELLHQSADPSALERLLEESAARGGGAAFRAASVLAQLGRRKEALNVLQRVESAYGPSPAIDMFVADLLREEGAVSEALLRARAAAAKAPGDSDAPAPLARLLLMTGALEEAEGLARRALASAPDHQLWLAFLWTALASKGSPSAKALLDFDRDVSVFDLDPPDGFASIEAFNAALAAELEALHRVAGAPLGQSVRAGSQTRRPLQTLKSPAIAAFFPAVVKAVDAFAKLLPDDSNHPFHRRKAAPRRVSGAWSVALAPGGRHAAHVHPRGWISSAYYIELPDRGRDEASAGCLALGQPPFPTVGLETAQRIIAPAPGRLVLFPSFCWHGTIPFAAPGRRLTIAFDIAAR